jgi:hypothetical protein
LESIFVADDIPLSVYRAPVEKICREEMWHRTIIIQAQQNILINSADGLNP